PLYLYPEIYRVTANYERTLNMSENDNDLKRIQEIIEIMKENDLAEVEISHGDDKIHLKRSNSQHAMTAVPMMQPTIAGEPAAEKQDDLTEIPSPMIGTFYAQPSPDSQAFVEVGTHITVQTVICIIEAMKVMNEIKAETSGTIVEILVSSGQAVEFGQPLFKIKPD
ncbi:acetyl-CoA carboxylase biotin carboxyl carrier protein, partial [Planctomycetota bacterium]